MKNLMIASTSTLHGGGYLEYILPELKIHFASCKSILFIPFARPGGISHEDYSERVKDAFAKINIDVKGLHTTLSVDLKLIQMEMNKDVQLMVFEQISNTQVIEAKFKNIFQKWGFHLAIWYYQKFREEDPLGKILEHFEVVTVKDDLLYLDLNRWFSKKPSIIETLSKVHVNRARVRPAELIVWGNVNLTAILSPSNEFDEEDDLDISEVTPIQQKDSER